MPRKQNVSSYKYSETSVNLKKFDIKNLGHHTGIFLQYHITRMQTNFTKKNYRVRSLKKKRETNEHYQLETTINL